MKEPPNGEWTLLSSQLTDKTGRITYKVTPEKLLKVWARTYKLKCQIEMQSLKDQEVHEVGVHGIITPVVVKDECSSGPGKHFYSEFD